MKLIALNSQWGRAGGQVNFCIRTIPSVLGAQFRQRELERQWVKHVWPLSDLLHPGFERETALCFQQRNPQFPCPWYPKGGVCVCVSRNGATSQKWPCLCKGQIAAPLPPSTHTLTCAMADLDGDFV